jgi:hypothetical protein
LHYERLNSRAHDRPSMGGNFNDVHAFGGLDFAVIDSLKVVTGRRRAPQRQ